MQARLNCTKAFFVVALICFSSSNLKALKLSQQVLAAPNQNWEGPSRHLPSQSVSLLSCLDFASICLLSVVRPQELGSSSGLLLHPKGILTERCKAFCHPHIDDIVISKAGKPHSQSNRETTLGLSMPLSYPPAPVADCSFLLGMDLKLFSG